MAKRYDCIVEVEKFNPYHDARGRFTTSGSATSFTYKPGKSKAHDNAIAREKKREQDKKVSYERIPYSVQMGQGTKEEKKKKTETITRFMNEAKVGNVYSTGSSVGSSGGSKFEIVHYNRSPNKMGIRSVGTGRAVAMSRENVFSWIKNGAILVSQKSN